MALGNKHMASKALVYFWLSAILLFIELSYPMALILWRTILSGITLRIYVSKGTSKLRHQIIRYSAPCEWSRSGSRREVKQKTNTGFAIICEAFEQFVKKKTFQRSAKW